TVDRRGAGLSAVRGRVLVSADDQGLSDGRWELHRCQRQLGTLPGLTAAGSLLISYTLTVAVSVAAGVKALASAYPALDTFSAEIGVAVILVVTLVNLRGIRESGSIFMLPTYVFLGFMALLLGIGIARFGL